MPQRKTVHRPLKQYTGGDMDKRIVIHTRVLTSPKHGSGSVTEKYDEGLPVWAGVFSLPAGKKIFDDIDLGKQPTHLFSIRYRPGITAEKVVRFRGNAFEIVRIINPEERDEWLLLYSKLWGDEDKEANQ